MKFLKQYLLFISACHWIIYFCSCFLKWKIYNPFWWALELPYNPGIRGIVFMISFAIIFFGCIFYPTQKDEVTKQENKMKS